MALGAGVLFHVLLILIISPGATIFVLPFLTGIFVVLVAIGVLFAGPDSRMINTTTHAKSLATGSPSGTDASLINLSWESESIGWDKVGSVTIQIRERTILIKRPYDSRRYAKPEFRQPLFCRSAD